MVCHKNSLLVFGGFYDTGKTVTCVLGGAGKGLPCSAYLGDDVHAHPAWHHLR